MQDAWRAYLELALGLTEASKRKAQQIAKRLAGQGEATAAQLQAVAEELVAARAADREALAKLVRTEVDRAIAAVGLARADEVTTLRHRVRELEDALASRPAMPPAPAGATGPAGPAVGVRVEPAVQAEVGEALAAPSPRPAAKKAVAKRAVAKKAVAKRAVAKAAVQPAAPEKAAVKKAATKKAVAKKTVARKVER